MSTERTLALVAVAIALMAAWSTSGQMKRRYLLSPPPGESSTWASVHDPFDGEMCSMCHTGDGEPAAVEDFSNELCLQCHDDPTDGKPVKHNAEQGRCLDCHNPHGSTRVSLLHDTPRRVCTSCHAFPGEHHAGASLHGPIKGERACLSCHLPHGGEHRKQLNAPFPEAFYVPYSKDTYGLCFTCHQSSLVEEKVTTTATQFRHGSQNLHALHVDRGDRGRSCRACHGLHAAPQPHLIEDSVAFGSHGWRLPVRFKLSEHGGSCAKTCHLTRSYDRQAEAR
jgi:predicted CXXCH cytochrome family protein